MVSKKDSVSCRQVLQTIINFSCAPKICFFPYGKEPVNTTPIRHRSHKDFSCLAKGI